MLAEAERHANLLVPHPLCYEADDVSFARCEGNVSVSFVDMKLSQIDDYPKEKL